jgi:hypothetical protein
LAVVPAAGVLVSLASDEGSAKTTLVCARISPAVEAGMIIRVFGPPRPLPDSDAKANGPAT